MFDRQISFSMRRRFFAVTLVVAALPVAALASPVDIPNTFADGGTIFAEEFNENFDAIADAVNDNDARIAALETAVADGFLVPPRVQQVDLKFPRQGIVYDELSDEEKEQWEELDWGDDVEPDAVPDRVNAAAINSWLFNKDTVDKFVKITPGGSEVMLEGGAEIMETEASISLEELISKYIFESGD